jgi:hypothetical protein
MYLSDRDGCVLFEYLLVHEFEIKNEVNDFGDLKGIFRELALQRPGLSDERVPEDPCVCGGTERAISTRGHMTIYRCADCNTLLRMVKDEDTQEKIDADRAEFERETRHLAARHFIPMPEPDESVELLKEILKKITCMNEGVWAIESKLPSENI